MKVGNRIKERKSKRCIEPEQKRSAREIVEDVEKVSFDNSLILSYIEKIFFF